MKRINKAEVIVTMVIVLFTILAIGLMLLFYSPNIYHDWLCYKYPYICSGT